MSSSSTSSIIDNIVKSSIFHSLFLLLLISLLSLFSLISWQRRPSCLPSKALNVSILKRARNYLSMNEFLHLKNPSAYPWYCDALKFPVAFNCFAQSFIHLAFFLPSKSFLRHTFDAIDSNFFIATYHLWTYSIAACHVTLTISTCSLNIYQNVNRKNRMKL